MDMNSLPAPIFACRCGCETYDARSPNDASCGNCGCPALFHTLAKSAGGQEGDSTGGFLQLGELLPAGDFQSDQSAGAASKKKGKKRTVGELGLDKTDSVVKKIRVSSSGETGASQEGGIFSLKPCKVLERGHVHFSEIENIPVGARGVYKVAYDYKTIYVGSNSCMLRVALRGQFNGSGNKDLYDFIKSLSQRELEKVSVFWLEEEKYVHNCGKKTYLKCIEESEKRKPRFNCATVKKSSGSWCSLM